MSSTNREQRIADAMAVHERCTEAEARRALAEVMVAYEDAVAALARPKVPGWRTFGPAVGAWARPAPGEPVGDVRRTLAATPSDLVDFAQDDALATAQRIARAVLTARREGRLEGPGAVAATERLVYRELTAPSRPPPAEEPVPVERRGTPVSMSAAEVFARYGAFTRLTCKCGSAWAFVEGEAITTCPACNSSFIVEPFPGLRAAAARSLGARDDARWPDLLNMMSRAMQAVQRLSEVCASMEDEPAAAELTRREYPEVFGAAMRLAERAEWPEIEAIVAWLAEPGEGHAAVVVESRGRADTLARLLTSRGHGRPRVEDRIVKRGDRWLHIYATAESADMVTRQFDKAFIMNGDPGGQAALEARRRVRTQSTSPTARHRASTEPEETDALTARLREWLPLCPPARGAIVVASYNEAIERFGRWEEFREEGGRMWLAGHREAVIFLADGLTSKVVGGGFAEAFVFADGHIADEVRRRVRS